MKYLLLDLCEDFYCLAGQCPATCCAGWRIFVGDKDYERFLHLSPEWLRQDILSNIERKEDGYYFRHQREGRCAMLDEDGLCRIQRNAEEKTLCNTCRKYPRLINRIDGCIYMSMAASCPVVSDYLVQSEVGWRSSDGVGATESVSSEELSIAQDIFQNFSRVWTTLEQAGDLFEDKNGMLLSGFETMAEKVLDMILSCQEGSYLIEEFRIFEQDMQKEAFYHLIARFTEESAKTWEKVRRNYIAYRFVSTRIENPDRSARECELRTEAELFLIRTICFCRFGVSFGISHQDWCEAMQKVYRFCVHGKKMEDYFYSTMATLFSNEDVWKYLLL